MPLNKLFATLIILSTISAGPAQNVGTFRFADTQGSQTAKLVIRTKPFIAAHHRIGFATAAYLKKHNIQANTLSDVSIVTSIDGWREWFGTDGEIPRVEIVSMVITFGAKRFVIPRKLYADCFNPAFQKTNFIAKLNDAADTLFVFMAGSDAAGAYQVMWVLRNDGRHSRFVHNCSDCDFKDILLFLQKQ